MGLILQCAQPLPVGSVWSDCPASSQVWVSLDQATDFTAIGLTPENVAAAFGWGVGTICLLWFLGYALGIAIATIKKM